MKFWKICCTVLAVVAAPFLIQANLGCGQQLGLSENEDESFQNSYVCSCNCTTPSLHRELTLSFSEDDAEEKVSGGAVEVTSPDLDMSNTRTIGLRYRNVKIPKDATITSAVLQFTATSAGIDPLTLSIKAQADPNPPAFTTAVNNISSRMLGMAAVSWSPPNWNAGDNGMDQQIEIKTVLQEVVKQMGWAEGKDFVLVIARTGGMGMRHAAAQDGGDASKAPKLIIDYLDAGTASVGPQELAVCMTGGAMGFNPNQNGGSVPPDNFLKLDCEQRVQSTITGLAEACNYPANCTCTFDATSRRFASKCDEACVENQVEMNCSDFDPVHGNVTATNAPGDMPVCLTNSPMTQGLFGRRTRCLVTGNATIKVEDDDKSSAANGILQFIGTPCPGGPCAVGLEYRLNIGDVTFESVFDDETFSQLAGLGKSLATKEAMLSNTGIGTFLPNSTEVSARGFREDEDMQGALTAMNADVLNVTVKFGAPGPMTMCALSGNVAGNVNAELKRCEPHGPDAGKICDDNDDCEDVDACTDEECDCVAVPTSSMALGLNVTGMIQNQPPKADAGGDQTIECTDASGTPITLNGAASSDLDNNLKLFQWMRGSRIGPQVGVDPVSQLLQTAGGQSYVLRVIDAFGQTDEDTTMVSIEDTVAPEVHCGVAKHVLEIFNHNLVNVGLAAAAMDECEGRLPITVKVYGDENDELNTGDGVFSPDAKNFAVGALRLRSERRITGNGRVYLIVTEAMDTSGNRSFDCCTVIAPKSPRLQASLQSAEMQAQLAKNFCLANDGAAPSGYFVIGDGPIIGTKQ